MKTMTIGNKIASACGVLVVLTLILGTVSLWKIGRMNDGVESMTRESLPGLAQLNIMVASSKEGKYAMMSHIASDSAAGMSKAESAIAECENNFQAAVKSYESINTSARGRELLADVLSAHNRVNSVWQKVLPLSRALDNKAAYALWMAEAQEPAQARAKAFAELDTDNNTRASGLGATTLETGGSARFWTLVILVFSVCSGGLLAFFIIRGINQVLKKAVAELSEGAEQVSSASGQVSGSSQALAQGASEQAASLEETSASSEEMASMTRKNAENSQQAAHHMNVVSQRVVDANTTLDGMLTSMREIGVSSNKISKIIKVIDEIAFQTNILALNAAVEAARAGEAGMGFAVVADEVRNLAQRSAQAAKDTAALIEESILTSTEGNTKLGEVAASIHAITESANKVKTLVDEVDASSKEQAQGIEQISKAVAQMDGVTQQTAASAEESASASEELNAQSQALMAVVRQLQSLVSAGTGQSNVARKPDVTRRPSVPQLDRNGRQHPAASTPRKQVAALVSTRSEAAFPLDDSEFREF